MSSATSGGGKQPITTVTPTALPPERGTKWPPFEGEQARGILQRSKLDKEEQGRLLQSAAQILGSGVDPRGKKGSATGLVVGYVQSGKTLSFTTVIGLARDNGFPLVIVIAGNKTNLLAQAHNRLFHDLNVDGGDTLPAWRMRKNVRATEAHDQQLIKQTIEGWRDPTLDQDERATLVLTVLKQNQRLENLKDLLKGLDLRDIPVLVIDDEADQASLNTKVHKGEQSTIYRRLRELRAVLPCHTYLEYTATPQAPLLINIADTLSPDFVRVLEPGSGYVGGSVFFAAGDRYVRDIPAPEITPDDVPLPVDPPPTLLVAMRIFFVGLSASLLTTKSRRSMLIHPSWVRNIHRGTIRWVTAAKDQWLKTLALPPNDQDRQELLREFRRAYDDVLSTDPGLPPFDAIVGKLPRALRNTTVIEFNTNGRPRTPEITWRDAEGWILVGGQAVDRGFTVDSLTVTYMPRGVGMGNADALQQRARFFGYKRSYLGLCRIYLEMHTRQAFQDYVEHEEIMRRELRGISAQDAGLSSWRRRFVLSADLQPCRRSVISDAYIRGPRGGGWVQQRGAVMTQAIRDVNLEAINRLATGIQFERDTTYVSDEKAQQHYVAHDVPLQKVVNALVDYRLEDARDTATFTGILIALSEALRRYANITVSVYNMRPDVGVSLRTVSDNGTLEDGFQQGRTLVKGRMTYPGDAFFRSTDQFSVQIHSYELRDKKQKVLAKAAPLLAMHIPRRLAKEWLVQIQSGQDSK